MPSYISRCATFYPLILHQYKLCIGCRCAVFCWFLLALKSDIKHSTVSVYLISNPEENYLSNCQLEWCSTVGTGIMFVSAFVSFSHCFSLMCETCSLWSALCFFFLVYCPSVRLIGAAGRNKKEFLPFLSLLGDSAHLPPTSSALFLVGAH